MENINDIKLTGKEVLIVGGGTMGLFLANELVLAGKHVVIVETSNENLRPFKNNEFSVIGQLHSGISIGRTKAIGGTSNLWGGQLAKFTKHDLEFSNNHNQPEWPISWEELKNNYDEVFRSFGFDGENSEYTDKLTNDNIFLEKFHTYWLKQPNLKVHFYTKLKNSSNVTIYNDTTVFNMEYEGDKCISIDVRNNNGDFKISGFSKIVLAHGTFEIIRLLLKTKANEVCPYVNNDLIGKYFQDHICLRVAKVKKPSKTFFNEFANTFKNGNKLQPKIRLIPESLDSGHIGVSGMFSFSSDISYNLDNFKQFIKAVIGQDKSESSFLEKSKLFFKTFKSLKIAFPIIYRYLVDNKVYIPFNSEVTLTLQTQQISIKGSSVIIDENELDENGLPKVILDWKIDGNEFERIKLFCDLMKEYLENNKLGELAFEDWYVDEIKHANGEWKKHITDTYHMAGGTIMNIQKEKGVVDPNLLMHETSNVYVIGPCVLPTSSYANTGLTALALTRRLSKHLNSID